MCSDALRSDPNSPDVMALRGLLLFLTAKPAQATQHVQSALRLDPGHEAAMKLRKRIKDVERLKEEVLESDRRWREIVRTLDEGRRELDAIVREGEERIKAIEEAKAGALRSFLNMNPAYMGHAPEVEVDREVCYRMSIQHMRCPREFSRVSDARTVPSTSST